jgi:RNA polymerase sigma-70 factor (ECF subfamily)
VLRTLGPREERDGYAFARFEALFRENADTVLAYATRRSDPDTAQEIVAETFAVAWRRLDVVPDLALPWLLGVARNVLANERRSRGRAEALMLRLVREPVRSSDDPADVIDARFTVQAALDRLLPAEREVLELLAWEGLSPAQVSEALGCSRVALAVRMHRARWRFRQLLDAPLEGRSPSSEALEIGHGQRDKSTQARRLKEADDARYPAAP